MSISRMRILQVAALAVSAFAATTFKTTDANAVIYCVEGVYRAGCAQVGRIMRASSARLRVGRVIVESPALSVILMG